LFTDMHDTNLRRRELLQGGLALTAAAAAAPDVARADPTPPVLGPVNAPVAAENPDILVPPTTDAGTLGNLKYPFDLAHRRITTGGWAREVTVRELPIATTIAGVDMRLEPGAIRELHWHTEGEWALMLAGNARITAVDTHGRSFADDVAKGDLWFFPAGLPHGIQALDQGCEFLLVFDDGSFSENNTFLLTDWMDHTPPEVLAANFGLPQSAFAKLPANPAKERYIFSADVPGSLRDSVPKVPEGTIPHPFSFKASQMKAKKLHGGRVTIVDSASFTPSAIAMAMVELQPGGLRELHWHPNADEWQYWIEGQGRMTVFASQGTARTFDFQAGDVGYVPRTFGHYVQNTGTAPVRFLEMFRAPTYQDVSLAQWLGASPPAMVAAHIGLDRSALAKLPKRKPTIVS
jgi:oxalate decarboxylase